VPPVSGNEPPAAAHQLTELRAGGAHVTGLHSAVTGLHSPPRDAPSWNARLNGIAFQPHERGIQALRPGTGGIGVTKVRLHPSRKARAVTNLRNRSLIRHPSASAPPATVTESSAQPGLAAPAARS
jgi:hypothetical protein